MTCTNMYVDELLVLHFADLLSYVKKAEHAAASRSLPEGQLPPGFGVVAAEPVIRDFAARWTSAIESLHRCAPFKLTLNLASMRAWKIPESLDPTNYYVRMRKMG